MFGFDVDFIANFFSRKTSQNFLCYQYLIEKKRFICFQSVNNTETSNLSNFSIVVVSDDHESDFNFVEKSQTHLGKILAFREDTQGYLSTEMKHIEELRQRFDTEIYTWKFENFSTEEAVSIASIRISKLYYDLTQKINQYNVLMQFYCCLNSNECNEVFLFKNLTMNINYNKIDDSNIQICDQIQTNHSLIIKKQNLEKLLADKTISDTFRKFIDTVTPLKSLLEIASILKIPYNEVKLYSSHLIYWKQAKLVNTFTKMSNAYRINDDKYNFQQLSQRLKLAIEQVYQSKNFQKEQDLVHVEDKFEFSNNTLKGINLIQYFSTIKDIYEYTEKFYKKKFNYYLSLGILEACLDHDILVEYEPHVYIDQEKYNEYYENCSNDDEEIFLEKDELLQINDKDIRGSVDVLTFMQIIIDSNNSNQIKLCNFYKMDIDSIIEIMKTLDDIVIIYYIQMESL